MKVTRDGPQHSLKELEVSVMLAGNFDASYTMSDNHLVVPTDTMKNTVHILAQEKLGVENEEFGIILGEHFLKTYPQVRRAEIEIAEHHWERTTIRGTPHPHSFVERGPARPFTKVVFYAGRSMVDSGIENLLIAKTTGSGFAGYVKDKFTTLPETDDRILATRLKAVWSYDSAPKSYSKSNTAIIEAVLEVFATEYSASVQATLYQMGEAALKAVPEISQITLTMPNQHCLLVNLAPFGMENKNELFVPTDEPHGLIEGTVSR
jgi:urate oxidase